jgi:NADH-quinone oxidoreductase subunit L
MGHGAEHGSGDEVSFVKGFFGVFTHALPMISLAVALLGILLAYVMYCKKWISAEKIGHVFKPIYIVLSKKYWFDELYEGVIVKQFLYNGVFRFLAAFDSGVVDGAINTAAGATAGAACELRKLQTGQTQLYAVTIGIGVIAIAVCVFLFS